MATKGIAHWRKIPPRQRNSELAAAEAERREQLRAEIAADMSRPLFMPMLTPIEREAIASIVLTAKMATHWRGVH